jgi:hypothetical protein
MRKLFFLSISFLMVFLAACGSKAQTSAPVNALYFDNFDSSSSGWSTFNTADGVGEYADGSYRIQVDKAGTLLVANPGKDFNGDVSIEVDARRLAGPEDNYYGVVCHYKDPNNYYLFMITSDGFAGISMRKAGVDKLISPGLKFLQMDGIKGGKAVNHIRVDCIGETLTLFANGKQVNLAYDHSLTGGDVGVAVRSGRLEGGTEISFDDFTVMPVGQP